MTMKSHSLTACTFTTHMSHISASEANVGEPIERLPWLLLLRQAQQTAASSTTASEWGASSEAAALKTASREATETAPETSTETSSIPETTISIAEIAGLKSVVAVVVEVGADVAAATPAVTAVGGVLVRGLVV